MPAESGAGRLMKRLMSKSLTGALLVVAVMATHAGAAQDNAPERKRYVSANGRYAFEVILRKRQRKPRDFDGRAENLRDAKAANGIGSHYTGVFSIGQNGSYYSQLSIPLVNETLPVNALVSDSGQYVVTFEDSRGPSTVVIYRTDGTLIKRLGLEELLTEDDISMFADIDGLYWGGDHYLDEGNDLLVLKFPNAMPQGAGEPKFYELKIELPTGHPIEPKRSFLVWSGADGELPDVNERSATFGAPCAWTENPPDVGEVVYLASSELVNSATTRATPVYPAVAKAARARGTVVVEVLVDEKGTVRCAHAVSGHPLLQAATTQAARKWRFAPLESFDSAPAQRTGTIAFHFGRIRPARQ
jgi:TonB family protein